MDKPLLLEKYPGKGGWTYAAIPDVPLSRENPFGWVKVKGRIDDYELKQYKLMPMGNNSLFLPLKAAVRKSIGKQAGDWVHVRLFADESLPEVPEELLLCFENEDKSCLENFEALGEGAQKAYIDWIYASKTEATKANRIAKMMDRLKRGLKLHHKVQGDSGNK